MEKIKTKVKINSTFEEEKKESCKKKPNSQSGRLGSNNSQKPPNYQLSNRFLLQNSLNFEEDGKLIQELELNMSRLETDKEYLNSMYNLVFKKNQLIDRVQIFLAFSFNLYFLEN